MSVKLDKAYSCCMRWLKQSAAVFVGKQFCQFSGEPAPNGEPVSQQFLRPANENECREKQECANNAPLGMPADNMAKLVCNDCLLLTDRKPFKPMTQLNLF